MHLVSRRAVVAGLLTSSAGLVHAQSSTSGPWPVAQTTLIVPFPPGGSTDALARLIQPGLQQRIGAGVIVENKAGASGGIGAAQVAKAAPDGSMLLVTFDSHAVNPALQPLPFDTATDLEPVMLVGTAPYVLACHPSRPYKTLGDVLAAARATPGKLSFASVGTGTYGHLAMTLLAKRAGVDILHVPYRGGGPAMNDAIAGHVDMICGSVALITPQIAGGGLRPLVQMGKTRISSLAETETAEQAGFAGFEALAWWGIFAPKATPAPLVQRIYSEIRSALQDERARKLLTESQQMTLRFGNPAELGQFLTREMKIWGDVVRDNGIKGG